MVIYPRWGSRARWIEPIRRRQSKKSKVGIEKSKTEWIKGDEIYLNSLILVRHWKFDLGVWWPRVWIWVETPTDCEEQEWVLNGFSSKTLGIYGQFRNKITFIPQLKGHMLTPKNGTRKRLTCGPSLVVRYHSARENLLKGFGKGRLRSAIRCHSAKGLFALSKGSFRECVMTCPDKRKERVDAQCEMDIGVGALI
jgi:hypothetical protein